MFAASDDELITKFHALKTNDDLADLLEIKGKSLHYFAYSRKAFYNRIDMKKKNGKTREIYVPCNELKTLQRKIAYILNLVYHPKTCVYGFVQSKSALDNARQHLHSKYILSIDLKDFFYQLHFGRVRGMLMKYPYYVGTEAATALANLMCVKRILSDGTVSTVLPQGAPTSPIVSNMICTWFDKEMCKFSKKYNLVYTRYADDITLSSGTSNLPRKVVEYTDGGDIILSKELNGIFERHKLIINTDKTRIKKFYRRQMVTGVVVNEKTNVKRQYSREIRAILHQCVKESVFAAAKTYANKYSLHISPNEERVVSWFRSVLKGRIEYLGFVTEKRGAYYDLAHKFNSVFGSEVFDLSDIYNEDDIINSNVFIIENDLGTQQGTVFIVPGLGAMTCSHVLENGGSETKEYFNSFSFYTSTGYPNKIAKLENIVFDKTKDPFDKDLDFALFLDLDKRFPESKRIRIGDSDKVKIGDEVTLVGYPEYLKGTYTRIRAAVSSITTHFEHPLYSVAETIKHGFSGGIVLNSNNEVVGIVSAGITSMDGGTETAIANSLFGFIPINCICRYISDCYGISCN